MLSKYVAICARLRAKLCINRYNRIGDYAFSDSANDIKIHGMTLIWGLNRGDQARSYMIVYYRRNVLDCHLIHLLQFPRVFRGITLYVYPHDYIYLQPTTISFVCIYGANAIIAVSTLSLEHIQNISQINIPLWVNADCHFSRLDGCDIICLIQFFPRQYHVWYELWYLIYFGSIFYFWLQKPHLYMGWWESINRYQVTAPTLQVVCTDLN